MPERLMIGTRIRERRVLSGIRQSDLARQAGISPSYLNLIEHNRRRIGGKTLLKLAEALEVEPSRLIEGAEAAVVSALREAAGESNEAERDRIEEFAGRFPGWAGLVVDLHRRTETLERTIDTLTDRLAHDPFLADSLHEVISAVTAIRATSSILIETEALEPEWQARFHRNMNEDAARLTEGAQALVRYLEAAPDRDADLTSPQDEMHAVLAARGYHFSELEVEGAQPEDIARLVAAKAQNGLSAPAQALLETVLSRYLDDARTLPLRRFQAQIDRLGPEPDRLAEATGAGLARIFRRLAALPEDMVGPVGLVICDASGTLIFRKPINGFAIPRLTGACALWPLYQAMAQPMAPLRTRVRQAGRGAETVQALAVAAPSGPGDFDRPAPMQAHMLLRPDPGEAAGAVRALGVSCRICPLGNCEARREPSILSEGF
ncbi:helix-turn-helix domain-containing protein [Roseovarius autotrophicus]|uniref:helix-turn-helix domain-containing protein n=1 Tax=Roseovarius autotrophicus TaxID=2824121 RepID=UPI001A0B712E|nr:helix-turn-helix transcriptional regulator [Roseovarius autotrophicus]MBE0452843.1 helix-turn-helix domain-containing protein [Roseovarius sp.]